MKITDVKINLMPSNKPLKAFVSITVDECFVIHDLRIIKNDMKTFVAMPSKKIQDSQGKDIYKDIAHPINAKAREQIEDAVMQAYDKAKKEL